MCLNLWDLINNGLRNQWLSSNPPMLFLFFKDISLVDVKSTGKSAFVFNHLQKIDHMSLSFMLKTLFQKQNTDT